MSAKRFFAIASLSLLAALFQFSHASAQEADNKPDLSVAGVTLGDAASGKAFLKEYQPTTGDNGQPEYYFYNKYATTVIRLAAESFDQPHKIIEIEVFAVGQSYMGRHFQLKDVGYFITGKGIFIGFRQSGKSKALALIVGIPNISRDNMIGPNDVIDRLGEPTERVQDGETESFNYRSDKIDSGAEEDSNYGYASHFEFRKRKLKRFSIALVPRQTAHN